VILRDPSFADSEPPRLLKRLSSQSGSARQRVIGRRRCARRRGRGRGRRRDLIMKPVEERLQRVDGQQQRFNLLTGEANADDRVDRFGRVLVRGADETGAWRLPRVISAPPGLCGLISIPPSR
jgi:hypothetical protein